MIRHFGFVGVLSPAVRQYRERLDIGLIEVAEGKGCGMKESHLRGLGFGNETAFEKTKVSRDRSKDYIARLVPHTASPRVTMSDQAAISLLEYRIILSESRRLYVELTARIRRC